MAGGSYSVTGGFWSLLAAVPTAGVPNLTIQRIPDGSHWVIHEKPAMVNGYIREFIR